MPKDTLFLACYDVTEDREREKVAEVLEGVGLRVQRSVFECRLTRSARERVLEGLRALGLQSGFVYLYPLDARGKRLTVGESPPEPFADGKFSLVV